MHACVCTHMRACAVCIYFLGARSLFARVYLWAYMPMLRHSTGTDFASNTHGFLCSAWEPLSHPRVPLDTRGRGVQSAEVPRV